MVLLKVGLFGVVLLEVAGLAKASGVGHQALVLTLRRQLLAAVYVVAMIAHALGIVLGFSVWTASDFAISLGCIFLFFRCKLRWARCGFEIIVFSVPCLCLVGTCCRRGLLVSLLVVV